MIQKMTIRLKEAYRYVNQALRKVGEKHTRFTPCEENDDCVAVQILHECHPSRPDEGSSCRWDFPSELEASRFLEGYAACVEWMIPHHDPTLTETILKHQYGEDLP